MKRIKGFTLLELMMAIGIFAVVSAIAYGSLSRLLNDSARLESEHAFWRGLSLTFTRMEEDFARARPRSVRDAIGNPLPAFRGQPTDTRATGAPSVEFTRGGVLTLDTSARSDLQRIGYRLTDDGELKKIVWPVLDQGPQSTPRESPLLSQVEEFHIRFFSATGAWLDQWPVQGINEVLPRGVEIRLTLTGRGEFTRLFLING
jgi:general secretion pathway protein J